MESSKVTALMLASANDCWNTTDDLSKARFRSYIHCLLTSLGYFDDENGFYVDRIMDQAKGMPYYNKAIQRSVIEKCADKNEQNDPADVWAVRGLRCLMDDMKKEQTGGYKNFII